MIFTLYIIQFPLDIANLDIVTGLLIATSTAVTALRHYIISDLTPSNFGSCSKVGADIFFEVL